MASEFNEVEFNESEFNQTNTDYILSLIESVSSSDIKMFDDQIVKVETITASDVRTMLASILKLESIAMSDALSHVTDFVRMYTESITMSDALQKAFLKVLDMETITLTDTKDIIPNKVLEEAIFLTPDVVVTISGKGFNETVKLAAWLQVKKNPPVAVFGD